MSTELLLIILGLLLVVQTLVNAAIGALNIRRGVADIIALLKIVAPDKARLIDEYVRTHPW